MATTPFGWTVGIDIDAGNFLSAAALTDATTINAVNNLVISAKTNGWWSLQYAIWPMLGASSTSCAYNLISPGTSHSSPNYYLQFTGSPTYSSNGVLFPTTSDWANSGVYDNVLTNNNNSLSYYSLSQNTLNGYDMGVDDSTYPYNEMTIYNSGDNTAWFGLSTTNPTPANTKGLFMVSATVSDVKYYSNGSITYTKGSSPVNAFVSKEILIGYVHNAPGGGRRICGCATIGQGISDALASTMYTDIYNFQIAMSRPA